MKILKNQVIRVIIVHQKVVFLKVTYLLYLFIFFKKTLINNLINFLAGSKSLSKVFEKLQIKNGK